MFSGMQYMRKYRVVKATVNLVRMSFTVAVICFFIIQIRFWSFRHFCSGYL